MNTVIKFSFNGQAWHWNPMFGFFFLPVGPGRTRERIVKDGSALYSRLRQASGYL